MKKNPTAAAIAGTVTYREDPKAKAIAEREIMGMKEEEEETIEVFKEKGDVEEIERSKAKEYGIAWWRRKLRKIECQ